ncbi:hypothetical protein HK101_006881 [Irineochytrium annulatum]|nr:hypothetical protein HK101_006881 [Irineochytrium annulatum]
MQGHAGSVTTLHLTERRDLASPESDAGIPVLIVSSGLDEVVRVWEVVLSCGGNGNGSGLANGGPREDHGAYHRTRGIGGPMSVLGVRVVRCVSQPGCCVAAVRGSFVVGCRRRGRAVEGIGSDGTIVAAGSLSEGTRRRGGNADARLGYNAVGKGGGEGWWEVWALDVGSGAAGEMSLRTARLGVDEIGLGHVGGSRRALIGRRSGFVWTTVGSGYMTDAAGADGAGRGDVEDDDDDGWVDDDGKSDGPPRNAFEDDDDSDSESGVAEPLPVLSVTHIKITRWGVICGFGNYIKVVLMNKSE